MYPNEPQPQYGQEPVQPTEYPPAQPQAYAQPPADPRGRRLTLGDLLAGAGGLLIFFFSFAPFVSYDDSFIDRISRSLGRNVPDSFSAWGVETFMAPLSWWVILAGLLLAALAALRFTLPHDKEILGFRFSHLQVGLALFAFFVMLGYAMSAKHLFLNSTLQTLAERETAEFFDADPSFSWGGWLMLIASMIAVAGAVLSHLNVGPTLWPQPPKPAAVSYPGYAQPEGYPPPGGYQQQPGYAPAPPPPAQPQYPQPAQPSEGPPGQEQ